MRIAIAGASGFIGQNLIYHLQHHFKGEIVGLSRFNKKAKNNLVWKKCDVYSLLQVENALEDVDVAVYLIHSMMPSAHLCQGNFADYDLILADNFVRACKKNNVKKIIYLGGILPEGDPALLSPHLRSRFEVETIISSSNITSICLRAGLIIGRYGSSFQILYNLIKKIKFVPNEKKLDHHCEPVYVNDVVNVIYDLIIKEETNHKIYDIAGDHKISYRELIKLTAQAMRRKIYFLPAFTAVNDYLSSWIIYIITQIPRQLTHPLLKSLNHDMLANENRSIRPKNTDTTPLNFAILESVDLKPKKIRNKKVGLNKVRSVIRLHSKTNMTSKEVADAYYRWLPKFFDPWIKVVTDNKKIYFYFRFIKKPLLVLEFSESRTSSTRQLFYIVGGILADTSSNGRLEFRKILDANTFISAIHSYKPTLPWFVYILTQAPLHWLTMNAFSNYLKTLPKNVTLRDIKKNQ